MELLERINAGEQAVTPKDVDHIVRAYDAELRSADEAIGRLVAWLQANSLYDETLIVVTSDHGEEFGEHGWMGWHAHSLYDELLRVPLLIKFPGSRFAGAADGRQARGIDVAPTVLAALGIVAPESFAGRDLGLGLAGSDESPAAVSMHDVPGDVPLWSIRTANWKLKRVGRESLFDLVADPGERRNVVAQHSRVATALRSLGLGLLEERARREGSTAQPTRRTQQQLRELGYVE